MRSSHQVLVEMPKQRISTTQLHEASQDQHTPLVAVRRSQRLLRLTPILPNSHNSKPAKNGSNCPPKSSKNPIPSHKKSVSANHVPGSRRSLRLVAEIGRTSSRRRSPRLVGKESADSNSESTKIVDSGSNSSVDKKPKKKQISRVSSIYAHSKKVILRNEAEGEVGKSPCKKVFQRNEKSCVGGEVVLAVRARKFCKRSEELEGVSKKRKREEEEDKGSVQMWTAEQERALQNAYFTVKPTPNFWKEVSKLVPGKSAQDCFDKVHSDHMTPPQPVPRSRQNKLKSSPVSGFSLSASKLLDPCEIKTKRLSCYKRKSSLAPKTVRLLLQKHCQKDQVHEADLFSVLEPSMSSSTLGPLFDVVVSTPKRFQEQDQKQQETSSSGSKKPLSRFRGSFVKDLISPPVLKQVKNKALHEKYIDQLHCREAKRKSACAQRGKGTMDKENVEQIKFQKPDTIRTAKEALFSHAQDALYQIKCLHTSATGNVSDFDDEYVDIDDINEDEHEL
ncbi:hypothetical protein K2173_014590 [Erythroxylum novogranatense]|uniref:Myb-like domain-containing protein n=1 Tax=Erythroxylum novogranatense TaxID=1862640 RepID=A0AAV8THM5_9ROSI|nr:hypothetical protein K2173_014590 [Erythroxylum novogranatense]